MLLPDGRTIETTSRSAGGGSHRDLVVTVFLPFGWQTQPYTFESHTSSSWSLGGDFSMGLSRGVWGNVTRHSPQIAGFLRTDTHSSHSTRTDATGTQTNQSQTVTTTGGGSGGDSLDQTWASEYSWSHTPPPPGGGSGSGGGSGGGGGEPTGGSSSGGEAGAVADVPGYLGGQIDSGTPGTVFSPGQALQSLYDYLVGLYGPNTDLWPEELRERLFGHEHEDGYVPSAGSQGWNQYVWVMDLYNSLYSNRPGTEGTPVGVRPIEEIGSGGGEGEPTAYQPFWHGPINTILGERLPFDEGSDSGYGDANEEFLLAYAGATPGTAAMLGLVAAGGLPAPGSPFGRLAKNFTRLKDEVATHWDDLKNLDPQTKQKLLSLGLDLTQFGLDVVGIFEPTPTADLVNTLISLGRRDWLGAGLSAASMVPLGDLAKAGKFGKYVKSVGEAIELARKSEKIRGLMIPVFRQLNEVIDAAKKVPYSQVEERALSAYNLFKKKYPGVDWLFWWRGTTPQAVTKTAYDEMMKHLDDAQRQIDEFLYSNAGKLVFDPATKSWTSPAGLVFGQGSAHGNRIKHVLEHLVPNPLKATHSIFNVDRTKLIGLLDEAWAKKGVPLANDPGAYVIDMGRVVGTAGQTKIKIIVRPGTSQIITAYPIP